MIELMRPRLLHFFLFSFCFVVISIPFGYAQWVQKLINLSLPLFSEFRRNENKWWMHGRGNRSKIKTKNSLRYIQLLVQITSEHLKSVNLGRKYYFAKLVDYKHRSLHDAHNKSKQLNYKFLRVSRIVNRWINEVIEHIKCFIGSRNEDDCVSAQTLKNTSWPCKGFSNRTCDSQMNKHNHNYCSMQRIYRIVQEVIKCMLQKLLLNTHFDVFDFGGSIVEAYSLWIHKGTE